MARLRMLPHRVATSNSVKWREWMIVRGSGAERLASPLRGWDYASVEILQISVETDSVDFFDETGVSLDEVVVIAEANCLQAQQRLVATSVFSTGESIATVGLTLPPRTIAGSVRLVAHLALAESNETGSGLRAVMKGARLHASEPFNLILERDAARFPTEAVPFSTLGYANAPWTVSTRFAELTEDFIGTVRLLINTENPVGQLALKRDTIAQMTPMMRADVLRILVGRVARDDWQLGASDFEAGSVGAVLAGMCETFLGHGIVSACQIYRNDSAEFERLLSERIEPYSGIVTA